MHTPGAHVRWPLPLTFSTFDYRGCARCCASRPSPASRVRDRDRRRRATGDTVHTDRGELRAPLVVDALGWRRVLSARRAIQPPDARLSRGLEVHPDGSGERARAVDRPRATSARATAGASRRGGELRVGCGSFEPRDHVKDPTVALAGDLDLPAVRYQGNWIPHQLRPATEDGVFFVGDSAGHCLPLTAEGIRPALYFGLALRARAARVVGSPGAPHARARALERYGGLQRRSTRLDYR